MTMLGFLAAAPGCGTLPVSWCKSEKVQTVIVGELGMRQCSPDVCLDACGYPPTPQCEDACDMDCIARVGEWISSPSQVAEDARLMEGLIRRVEECRP